MRHELLRRLCVLLALVPSCMLTSTEPPLVVDCAAIPDSAERYPDQCAADAGPDADVDAGP